MVNVAGQQFILKLQLIKINTFFNRNLKSVQMFTKSIFKRKINIKTFSSDEISPIEIQKYFY